MGSRNHASRQWEEQEGYNHERRDRQEDREEEEDESHTVDDSPTAGLLSRREDSEKQEKMHRPSFWGRVIGWRPGGTNNLEEHVLLAGTERMKPADEVPSKGCRRRRGCFVCVLAIFVILGFIQSITLLASFTRVIFPSKLDRILAHWGELGHAGFGLSSWPTDFSRDIRPIPLHSHNDYWRMVPLYDALKAGAIGVEADVWLIDDELYVGHTRASLTKNRTLKALYVDPLTKILEGQNDSPILEGGKAEDATKRGWNGVFDTALEQTLVLLIDFKQKDPQLWPRVLDALQPLRERGWLSHVNGSQKIEGPITVVATGEAKFDSVQNANPHSDIFFDAPLNEFWDEQSQGPHPLGASSSLKDPSLPTNTVYATTLNPEAYTTLNSYYVSCQYPKHVGLPWSGEITDGQLKLIRGQIKGAQKRGLKVRYWDTPFWPIGLRNKVWNTLVKEGVDILNVDDLKGAGTEAWGKRSKWWKPGKGS